MISIHDFYNVMSAVVPLYVAMILAYGSVKWWKLVTPEQCAGINRFVALFAVPLLSFQIISHNDPYNMSVQFIIADIIQKLIVLFVLGVWTRYSAKGSLEWFITLFMVSTLPNTLVMGIPLERAMYGKKSGGIVVQAVVLQCVLWYTLLLFLFEYRSAKLLIMEQFPDTAGSIVSFKVDPDVHSLDGRDLVRTEAAVSEDGKIHVKVRRSTSSMSQEMNSVMSSWKSPGLTSMISSKAATPRASNLTGAEIYSLQSSRNMTPNGSSFNKTDFYSLMSTARGGSSPFVANSLFDPDNLQSSNHSSSIPTPKEPAHLEEGSGVENLNLSRYTSPEQSLNPSRNEKFGKGLEKKRTNTQEGMDDLIKTRLIGNVDSTSPKPPTKKAKSASRLDFDSKDLQMFVWSSSASPVSEKGSAFFGGQFFSANGTSKADSKIPTAQCTPEARNDVTPRQPGQLRAYLHEDFSFVENVLFRRDNHPPVTERAELSFKGMASPLAPTAGKNSKGQTEMPPTAVMSRLILDMVWRKLIRNPNTYSSLFGIAWSLVSFKYNMAMPRIIENSITILSDAGLGMAMFSLGLFMALQPRLLACGKVMTIVAMVVRFITGPAVMSATSIAIGMRDIPLKAAIIQAALPQGIVPFVFAKEYNVHPDILSTAVIVGMLVSLPISLLYYLLLNL